MGIHAPADKNGDVLLPPSRTPDPPLDTTINERVLEIRARARLFLNNWFRKDVEWFIQPSHQREILVEGRGVKMLKRLVPDVFMGIYPLEDRVEVFTFTRSGDLFYIAQRGGDGWTYQLGPGIPGSVVTDQKLYAVLCKLHGHLLERRPQLIEHGALLYQRAKTYQQAKGRLVPKINGINGNGVQ